MLTPKSRAVETEILMEQLFRQTDLEARIPLNMNVLDSGLVPKVMSLRKAHRRSSIIAGMCLNAARTIGWRG